MSAPIETYGLIGDCETAALVGLDGSVDWLCWPRFDSLPCLAALLGTAANGRWSLGPAEPGARVSRAYASDTLVLQTRHEAAGGRVRVTDFMPLRGEASDVVRIVTGEAGRLRMRTALDLRFDGGQIRPLIMRGPGGLRAVTGPHAVRIVADVELQPQPQGDWSAEFEVAAGDQAAFVLTYHDSFRAPPAPVDPNKALADTLETWRRWAGRSRYEGPWRGQVLRSLITLKALTYRPTGGLVAAPTSSLPEDPSGGRTWDYRYCWLRDATFTLMSLAEAGHIEEARAWRDWLVHVAAGDAERLQPVYTIRGERHLGEWEADWLEGYRGAQPVRFGNDAAKQRQLDTLGEVVDALYQAERRGVALSEVELQLLWSLVERIERSWREPDRGIWETRGPPRRFTHSLVLAWVGADRAARLAEGRGAEPQAARWRELRDRIHAEVCSACYDPGQGCFTQGVGLKALDAATLLIPLVGFLPAEDARVRGTVDAVGRRLMEGGFVRRYDLRDTDDGLMHTDAPFLACSFWYADNLALQGRMDEAREVFERVLTVGNDLGLFAEEYDPARRRLVGNFPQALTHVSLIGAAFNLTGRGPAHRRAGRDPAGRADVYPDGAAGTGPGARGLPPGDKPRARGPAMSARPQVVVVTGASAGVGRAVAHRFARAGARLGLIARDEAALEEVRREVETLGVEAVCAPADVADAQAVFEAAERIEQALGPIDVWVNDAMATVFSPVWDLSPDEFRRVTEVTYLGFVHGTMAALRSMRPRRKGVIVQVGSALAYRGIPLQSAYCGAKHAIRGFTDSLRAELRHERSPVRLSMVELPAINTPQFDWARTHCARRPRPMGEVFEPEVAAHAIWRAARRPRREYWLGRPTLATILGNMVWPGYLDRYLARTAFSGQATAEPVRPDRRDNLYEPVYELHRTRGSFEAEAHGRAVLAPGPAARAGAIALGVLACLGVGVALGRASASS
jgi:GH15 family glucan-1,4-alpha-glucosidase/NAD(P)-dependent dehydrogenase (short-subunit alcohol dehydrogenase family)